MEDIQVTNKEQRLAFLLNNLDAVTYDCRYDERWTMEYLNTYCQQLTGYSPDELIHNNLISYSEIFHPEDREYVKREIEKAIDQKSQFNMIYKIIREIYSDEDVLITKEYLDKASFR